MRAARCDGELLFQVADRGMASPILIWRTSSTGFTGKGARGDRTGAIYLEVDHGSPPRQKRAVSRPEKRSISGSGHAAGKEETDVAAKILVIEDDPATLRLVDYTLRQEKYKIIKASNGLEGLRKAREETPDLVILDVMLPGMDGYEICHQLRAEPATADILILMFSAKAQEIDKDTGLKVGANDYLPKPASPMDIVDHVEKLLASQHTAATATDNPRAHR